MRKITCALLALLIVAALLPVSAAAACDHSFYQAEAYKATCTEDGYYILRCSECGYEEKYVTEYAYGHNWVEFSREPASCMSEGMIAYRCGNCGEFGKTETIPRKPHSFGSWFVTTPASCYDEGIKTRECSYCGVTERVSVPRTQHNYVFAYVMSQPTTTSEGYELYVCSICETEYVKTLPKLSGGTTVTPPPALTPEPTQSPEPTETPDDKSADKSSDKERAERTDGKKGVNGKLGKGTPGEANAATGIEAPSAKDSVPVWAIIMAAVGVLAAIAAGIVFFVRKRKRS